MLLGNSFPQISLRQKSLSCFKLVFKTWTLPCSTTHPACIRLILGTVCTYKINIHQTGISSHSWWHQGRYGTSKSSKAPFDVVPHPHPVIWWQIFLLWVEKELWSLIHACHQCVSRAVVVRKGGSYSTYLLFLFLAVCCCCFCYTEINPKDSPFFSFRKREQICIIPFLWMQLAYMNKRKIFERHLRWLSHDR